MRTQAKQCKVDSFNAEISPHISLILVKLCFAYILDRDPTPLCTFQIILRMKKGLESTKFLEIVLAWINETCIFHENRI